MTAKERPSTDKICANIVLHSIKLKNQHGNCVIEFIRSYIALHKIITLFVNSQFSKVGKFLDIPNFSTYKYLLFFFLYFKIVPR